MSFFGKPLQGGILQEPIPKVFPKSCHAAAIVNGSIILISAQCLMENFETRDKSEY
jgi:hypothetical protein